MKTCHLTSVHRSDDIRILKKQCVSLAKLGYDVYLVATGESFEYKKVKIIGLGEVKSSRLIRMFKTTKLVYQKGLELDCDIYHLHDPELLPYALKLKKRGKKVIFDSHESYTDTFLEKKYIPKLFRKPISSIFDKYLKYVAKRIDVVICCYHQTQQSLVGYNENIPLIFNFPIIENVDFEYKQGKNICYAGGLMEQWNHQIIAEAIKDTDVNYILMGKSTEYIKSVIENYENIDFKGMLKYDEVLKYYSQSQIGMCLLDYIGQCKGTIGNLSNTKFFEYLMVGLPIICTDFVLWKEIIDEYNCGICVNATNSDDIKNAINYLLQNPELAKQMGENGKKAIFEKYNWGTQEEILISLYERLERE
ncbi:MAG: glycosyltransferase [Clostridia bacterium]